MAVCTICGNQNDSGLKFCTSCGKPLAVTAPPTPPPAVAGRSCPACGASNSEAARFCVQCGKNILQEAPLPPVATPPPPPIAPPTPAVAAEPPAWKTVAAPSSRPAATQPPPAPAPFVAAPSAMAAEAQPAPAPAPYVAAPLPAKGKSKTALVLIILAIVLLAALGGTGYYGYSLWKKYKTATQPSAEQQPAQSFAPLPEPSANPDAQPAQNAAVPAPANSAIPSGNLAAPEDTGTSGQQTASQQPEPPPPPPTSSAGATSPKTSTQAAVLIKKVQPKYPLLAKMSHVSGIVKLRVVIAPDGSVKGVTVISGPKLLTKSATDAVKQWRYKPYMVNGKPAQAITETFINFKLGAQ